MCSRSDDPSMHDPLPRRYIRAAGDDTRHGQSPEDDPRSAFRLTLCGKVIADHRGWSSGPADDRNPIDCPVCMSPVPPEDKPIE